MTTVEKLPISLPKEDAARLRSIARHAHAPVSAIVRVAVRHFFAASQKNRIFEQYRKYYAMKSNREFDKSLAKKMHLLSRFAWPRG